MSQSPTPSNPAGWNFETRQIHAGQDPDPASGARALPIQQTTSFVFPDAATAAGRFALQELGPIYTRLNNPTVEVVENRIASLEGGVAAVMVASGQAATTYAILNIAGSGDHVVASASLYGGTFNLFKYSLAKLGIEVTFVTEPENPRAWAEAVRSNTKAFYAETIPNPRNDVLDIQAVAEVAHASEVPLIVDNTVATPYLIRPIEWGADVVVHSATKFLGGHGTSIGGFVVDSGNFDYTRYPQRFPDFVTPDPSYNNLVFGEVFGANGPFGANVSYAFKVRTQLLRDLGAAIAPFNAFLIEQGIETLSLRMQRHVSNATAVAQWLESRDDVVSVSYAGLESSPWFATAQRYAPAGAGSIVGFVLDGAAAAGQAFADALVLHSNVANIGDVRSLVIHPASTTHSQLSPQEQADAGVQPGFVRLSVGLEHIDDILADLELGFDAAASAAAADTGAA